jgi:hypothetical protein
MLGAEAELLRFGLSPRRGIGARPVFGDAPILGVMGALGDWAAKLEAMSQPRVNGIIRDHLKGALPPVKLAVRGAILATPSNGPKHTGLRAAVAACVDSFAEENADGASAGVFINPSLGIGTNGHYYSLPFYLEGPRAGGKYSRWRHPVYQTPSNPDTWTRQDSHPYWHSSDLLFLTGRIAAQGAVDEILRDISP